MAVASLRLSNMNAGAPNVLLRGKNSRPNFASAPADVLSAEQTLLAMRYLYQLDTLPDIRRLLDALSLAPSTA